VAAQVQRGVVVAPEPAVPRRLRAVDVVPYLSVLGVLALLVVASARHYATPLGVVVLAVIALVALAVARQVVTARDNERLLRAQAARASEARFAALVEKSSDVICILDAEGRIVFVSPSLGKVLGHRPERLAGHPFLELVHPDDQDLGRAYLSDLELRQGATTPLAWRLRHADGRYLHIETVGTNLKDDPQVQGVVLNSRDITERTQLEQRLTHLAFHDPLTQLANRALFHDRLAHALARLSLRPERKLAVMIVDLDNFKTINDSLGHGEGDRLLVEVASRLRARVRSGDTVARLGGDEFGVLLEDIEDSELVHATARAVVEAFKAPFHLDGHEAVVSVSVGVAHAAARETADDVLRNADLTLYVAKGRGKARIEVFEQEMHAAVLRRLQLETDLRQALERDELFLLYQPVIELRTGRIKGVEALMRWAHPSQGTLSPTLFIPVAEETGLIVPLGRVALQKACAQARRWQDELRLDRPLSMAVNLSGKQLIEGSIVGDVADALRASGLPSEELVLEITESVMMGDAPEVTRRLEELRALGVRIAIDDFGTGYSSLATLDRFPVDVLKIDRSFVARVDGPGDGAALARAVLSVGTALRLETVAEGIERPEQLAALRGLGCELGQGFLFARPEPPEAILARCRALATTTPVGEGGRGGRRVGTGTSPGLARRREDGE
ncbi:MAG: EAL domain-containing protein, partial [Polyangiaceae bacterium]|nr:EAL domain-containing protein [Polyangiaceae bacterium]